MKYSRILLSFLIIAMAAALGAPTALWAADAGEGKKLVVMPWKVNAAAGDQAYLSDAVAEMLTTRAGAAPGIAPVTRSAVSTAAARAGGAGESGALSTTRALNADYALFGSITVIGTSVSLDATLLDAVTGTAIKRYSETGKGLDSIVPIADSIGREIATDLESAAASATSAAPPVAAPASPKATPAVIFPTPAPVTEPGLRWRSADLDGTYTGMTTADIDGDGAREFFLVSPRTLIVAKVVEGRGLVPVAEVKSSAQNISVSAVDTDGDGTTEVYLSRMDDNRAVTVEVVYDRGEYRTAERGIGLLAREAATPEGEPVLIGQGMRESGNFYGNLRLLVRGAGGLKDAGPFGLGLPKRTDLFRVDYFDVDGDGETEAVSVDTDNRLRLFENGSRRRLKQVARSADHVGGTMNLIEIKRDPASGEVSKLVLAEGRITHMDVDNNGKQELIVRQNAPGGLGWFSKTPGWFKEGAVVSLEWDEVTRSLVERWKSRKFAGYLADFIIADTDGDGALELNVLVVDTGGSGEKLLGSAKSYVLSFDMSI